MCDQEEIHFNPFNNPRTIPNGWEVSSLQEQKDRPENKQKASKNHYDHLLDQLSMQDKLSTLPTGWDLS